VITLFGNVFGSGERDGGVSELLLQQPLGEQAEVFAGLGQSEGLLFFGPVELEAGGQGRDPDLPDGRVRGEDELAGVVLEDDVEDAVLLFGFEGNLVGLALLFGKDEGLLQSLKGAVGFTALQAAASNSPCAIRWRDHKARKTAISAAIVQTSYGIEGALFCAEFYCR
jgi:hypothetical protein